MKRIFIAIKVSEKIEKLAKNLPKSFPELPVRWLDGKNLHITVIPPWYEKNPEDIFPKLTGITGKIRPFEVIFDSVSFGSNRKNPRLIWASGKTPPQLYELRTECEKILGIPHETKPLLLHITLARFHPEDFPGFKIKDMNEPISWTEKINSIVIMESHLKRSGTDYEILKEFKL